MQINPTGTNTGNATSTSSIKTVSEDEVRIPGRKSREALQEREQFIQSQERMPLDEVEIIQAIEHANTSLEGAYTQFEFSIHEKTREIMVKVIDRDSGEVIREIPPEQILDMVAKIWELAGILIDERV